jgi:transglutaminase-like putative cysteine protease
MGLGRFLRHYLGQRPDLPTYLGGWCATLSWFFLVAVTIGYRPLFWVLGALTTVGFAVSFVLRGWREGGHRRAVDAVLGSSTLVRLGVLLAVLLALGRLGPLPWLVPEVAHGEEEWLIGTLFCWTMTLYSFGLVSEGMIAFASVPGVSMLGLMGTDNINPEVGVAFLCFLLGNVLMLSNMALGHYLGRRRRGPTGAELARWLGDQFIVAGLTVGVTAFLAIACGALLQVATPRFFVPGLRVPVLRGAGFRGYAAFAEQLEIGTGGPLEATPVLRVKTDRPVLLRRRVFDRIEGRTWSSAAREPQDLPARQDQVRLTPNATAAEALKATAIVRQRITFLAPVELAVAPLATSLTWQRGVRPPFVPLDAYGNVRLPQPPGTVVEVTSTVPAPTVEQLRFAPPTPPGARMRSLLEVPLTARAVIERTVQQLELADLAPYDAAERIQRFLERGFAYDATVVVPPTVPSPMEWYFEQRRGACDLIATAMVLLARGAGIPARLASGYSEGQSENGEQLIRLRDAHAWAELYFGEFGWIAYNPAVPGAADRAGGLLTDHQRDVLRRLRWGTVPGLALALWLAWYVGGELRRRRRRFRAQAAGLVAERYCAALALLAARRLGRQRHETPREHLLRLRDAQPDAPWLPALTRLTGWYERVRYGLASLSDDERDQVHPTWRELRRALRHRQQQLLQSERQPVE